MNEEERDLRNIFWTGSSAKKYLLVLVAHPDDFEIGCLGTILKLHKSSEDFAIRILTFCAQNNVRKEEQEKSIRDLKELNINIELTSFAFADTFLADSIKDVKKEIRNIAKSYAFLEKKVLPQLRRSVITVNYDEVGYSDEELKNLVATNPDTLTLE